MNLRRSSSVASPVQAGVNHGWARLRAGRGAGSAPVRRRLWALATLLATLVALCFLFVLAVIEFPRGLYGVFVLAAAAAAAWKGLVQRGARRVLGLAAAGLLASGFVVLVIQSHPALLLGLLVALSSAAAAGPAAFRVRVKLPPAPRPLRPVLFWNPRSGAGKALRLRLADEARARGIEPIELRPGVDLEQLVRQAVNEGADAVAVAGGDGSQAVVARVAAERGLPYACIPAGTLNHFALDLGVDRADVVGALDAFVSGGETIVDLADVNGRTFVNNVSLGLYGHAVQRASYRNAKLRTLLDIVPDVLGPGATSNLRWRDPAGDEHAGGAAIIVSNNRYRLSGTVAAGTRPRLDGGVLGVIVVGPPGDEPRAWTTHAFQVDARGPVPAGIDGEACVLEPPLRFSIRPAALRCRIAGHHPGASPSAFEPESAWGAIRMLASIAFGRMPREAGASG